MNDFITIIGTIASVGSIPLAIYLFLKSKENSFDKIKRDIVRILSHQIGSGNQLTTFEIQSVINSKLRDNKISSNNITVHEIIEDLMTEVISNPLIDNEKKEFYLTNFKSIYSKGQLLMFIDNMSTNELTQQTSKDEITQKVEVMLNKEVDARKDFELKTKKTGSLASWVGIFGSAITVIFGILATTVNKTFFSSFYDLLGNNELTTFIVSLTAGIISLFFATIFKKTFDKSKDTK